MNFSYKKLLKTHNHSYFDFVDINPDSDQAFYLDAEQISLCDDKYSRDATKAIDSFFYSLCEAAQNRDYNRLLNLCSFCGEVNMTHLGLSLKSSKGKGSSPQIIMKIVDGMISRGLFENESVTRFSDLSLLTPNFDKDRSSDLITNIIQNILYQFTVDQYKHWNLPLSNSLFSLHYWDQIQEIGKMSMFLLLHVLVKSYYLHPNGLLGKNFCYLLKKYFINTF